MNLFWYGFDEQYIFIATSDEFGKLHKFKIDGVETVRALNEKLMYYNHIDNKFAEDNEWFLWM